MLPYLEQPTAWRVCMCTSLCVLLVSIILCWAYSLFIHNTDFYDNVKFSFSCFKSQSTLGPGCNDYWLFGISNSPNSSVGVLGACHLHSYIPMPLLYSLILNSVLGTFTAIKFHFFFFGLRFLEIKWPRTKRIV